MEMNKYFELLENAVDKFYPNLTEDSSFSDSGVENSPAEYGHTNVWIQFENVNPDYIQSWLKEYRVFAKQFEDWSKGQEFIDCSIMGDSDTRTLTFEIVLVIAS